MISGATLGHDEVANFIPHNIHNSPIKGYVDKSFDVVMDSTSMAPLENEGAYHSQDEARVLIPETQFYSHMGCNGSAYLVDLASVRLDSPMASQERLGEGAIAYKVKM